MWQLKVVLEVETITKQIFSSSLPTEYIQKDVRHPKHPSFNSHIWYCKSNALKLKMNE